MVTEPTPAARIGSGIGAGLATEATALGDGIAFVSVITGFAGGAGFASATTGFGA